MALNSHNISPRFWRGAGAVERARLESVCTPKGVPRVRIPPSPQRKAQWMKVCCAFFVSCSVC